MAEEYDYLFKAVAVGDGGCGKTAIVVRFAQGFFQEQYKLTIGVEFAIKSLEVKKHKVKLQIWDTGGQERFQYVRPLYYKGSMGAVVVFDLTNRESFDHIAKWLEEVRGNAGDIPMLLVGNKSDLTDQRKVTRDEAEKLAKELDMYYIESSAKTGSGITDVFGILALLMIGEEIPPEMLGASTLTSPTENKALPVHTPNQMGVPSSKPEPVSPVVSKPTPAPAPIQNTANAALKPTPSPTPMGAFTPRPTPSSTPVGAFTPRPSPMGTPSPSPGPSSNPVGAFTPRPSPMGTPSPSPGPSPTPVGAFTPRPNPMGTPSPSPGPSPTPMGAFTPRPNPMGTPSPSPLPGVGSGTPSPRPSPMGNPTSTSAPNISRPQIMAPGEQKPSLVGKPIDTSVKEPDWYAPTVPKKAQKEEFPIENQAQPTGESSKPSLVFEKPPTEILEAQESFETEVSVPKPTIAVNIPKPTPISAFPQTVSSTPAPAVNKTPSVSPTPNVSQGTAQFGQATNIGSIPAKIPTGQTNPTQAMNPFANINRAQPQTTQPKPILPFGGNQPSNTPQSSQISSVPQPTGQKPGPEVEESKKSSKFGSFLAALRGKEKDEKVEEKKPTTGLYNIFGGNQPSNQPSPSSAPQNALNAFMPGTTQPASNQVSGPKSPISSIQSEELKKRNQIACPNCGAVLSKAFKFCNKCGSRIQ